MDGFTELASELLKQFGLAGLAIFILFVIVMLIVFGKMWPKRMVDDRLRDKQDMLNRQDKIIDKLSDALDELKDGQREQLEYAKTAAHALTSIQEAGKASQLNEGKT